ncbi:MAG: hypothetical protein WKF94_06055 [Solirubrobacteraceae bacterium]
MISPLLGLLAAADKRGRLEQPAPERFINWQEQLRETPTAQSRRRGGSLRWGFLVRLPIQALTFEHVSRC